VTEQLPLTTADVVPAPGPVLEQLGMPADVPVPARLAPLFMQAAALFNEHVRPAGIVADVSGEEFAAVYQGEGRNAPRSVVAEIAPRAEHLALFAVTLGAGVSDVLRRCFAEHEYALASVLDAMASAAADGAADIVERHHETRLRADGWATSDGAVLRYSPGYCGWDVTGQRRLFARLQPAAIGLTLTDSCLMQPLKSVSGVLLAGPRRIHHFATDYPFCDACETRTCRERLRAVFARTDRATGAA
jgi:hypothetical protein